MKMVHKGCGGKVEESDLIPSYQSEEYGIVPAYQCLKCLEEIVGDSQICFIPESKADKIQIEGIRQHTLGPPWNSYEKLQIKLDIDPVCLIHGKKQSENPPHWAGRCLFCCLCFKELESILDCMSTSDGGYEDICIECGHLENLERKAMTTPTICKNCYENINPLDRPKFFQKLWNAYFFCDDCGRMMRFTTIVVVIIMSLLGWFF